MHRPFILRLRRFVLILIALLLIPGQSPTGVRQASEPRRIDVLARRFAFEPAEINVVAGERIELAIRSGDGVHGIEIKKVKVKRQIPRGDRPIHIAFTAPEPGRYPIVCSEYCGADHDDMKGMLVVEASSGLAP